MSDYLLNSNIITPPPYTTNDKELITSYSFPNGNYTNITVGASGATYVVPADGWVGARHTCTVAPGSAGNGQCYLLGEQGKGSTSISVDNTWEGTPVCLLPVRKGETITIYYTRSTINVCRFYYAKGEF